MSVFKLAIVALEKGQIGLGFEPDLVELGGEWVERAKWRYVKKQCLP